MEMVSEKDLDNWFEWHQFDAEMAARRAMVMETAKMLAGVIIENTPDGADQSAAIRKLRECVMTATAAIACGEK